jgi:glutamate--cysteine ligase
MSNPGEQNATPIASRAELAASLEAGGKPRGAWRIGTEHEKFGFYRPEAGGDFAPVPYQPNGIGAILSALAAEGFDDIRDQGALIGLKKPGGESLSLEPGGQFELSGKTLQNLHASKREFDDHFAALKKIAEPMGIGFAPLGFHPLAARKNMPWMPKSRYAIMRRYMPLVGTLGLDMMLRTCTVQTNLDFADEADMREKLRISLLLQPMATALFANSPFTEGKPNGFLSYRAQVWTDTDNQRSGIPALFLDRNFGFERYVDYLLDVPMYFVARDGKLIDVAGQSFRDFMVGKIDVLRGIAPTLGDFEDHVTTVFTDVRLKKFIEMRGADAGTPAMMLACSALWTGLLYDSAAQAAALALVDGYKAEELTGLRVTVPREGLNARFSGGSLRDLARDTVAIAEQGLRARGMGEEIYLAPLQEIAAGAPTQAEYWLERYSKNWHGDVTRIFTESAI